jgi:hypothetical protein
MGTAGPAADPGGGAGHRARAGADFGDAVSVTELPNGTRVAQVPPQEMPAGELVTVPVPVPDLVTEDSSGNAEMPVPETKPGG